MRKKWMIDRSSIHIFKGKFWFLPCISFWYEKNRFLETGVETPALGLEIFWFNIKWGFVVQQTYM